MIQFAELTRRNLRIYFRDVGALFFSLLSMLIIIMLMVFFLGDMNTGSVTELLEGLPGHDTAQDGKNAELLVFAWTAAGIIPVNGVMVTLSSLSSMIKDRETGRINSVYTAPVSRLSITLSYIVSAWTASVIVCVFTLGVCEAILCSKGMEMFSPGEHIRLFGMILANSFTYSAVMYFFAMLIKNAGAWSGFGTVAGTLVGFLGGIYLPVGTLSDTVAGIIKLFPVFYGTVMFRNVMTDSILGKTFADAPAAMTEKYRLIMGIDCEAFGRTVSAGGCLAAVLAFGAAFTLIGALLTAYAKRRDR